MRKIILIFLALMLTMLMPLMVKRVNAADAWVLWKQRTEVQSDGEIKTRWFVQTSLTEYTVCYDMALRLAEQDRKTLNAGGKLTVVRVGDKEGEGVIIYYRCFPDTFDPGK